MVLKILIIGDNFPPEKVGAYRVYDVAMNLQELGFKVEVMVPPSTYPFGTFKRTNNLKTIEFKNGVKVARLWTWQPILKDPHIFSRIGYYLIFPLHATLRLFVHHDFDVIITSSGQTPLLFIPGLILKKIFHKKWIIDVHDLFIASAIDLGFFKKGGVFEKMARIFEKICYLSGDKILVVTKRIKNAIISEYKINEYKILIMPNATNTDLFYPRLVGKKKQLIYTGNIGHAQDIENVILAMKIITKHDVKLLIVGGGDVEDSMKKLAKDENLDEYVTFTGFVERNKIPVMVSESLVAFAPLKKLKGLEYAIPAKTYNYMACGIPIIACGSSELRDLINESGAGMFVDNNPQSIANAVIYLLNNQRKRDEMGTNGRKYIEKYYNIRNITKNMVEEIYKIS